MLYPFKWEHIIIPIVPDMCLEVLEAPVPFIVGVPKALEEGRTLTQDSWCQQTLIVMLDEGKVYVCGSSLEKQQAMRTLPALCGLEKGLADALQPFQGQGMVVYSPTTAQREAITGAHAKVRDALEKTVLSRIPKKMPMRGSGVADTRKVATVLVDAADPIDKEFVGLLCETQMFASLIEERCVGS